MSFTQEDITRSGYKLEAAPAGAWRVYDTKDPVPGYFQFDWLSSRHPDLYHQFALSTDGLLARLHTLVDLAGCDVVDIGAGTGRSAMGAAQKANRVFAVELYSSVVSFAKKQLAHSHLSNVHYIHGNRELLPLPENSMDVAINVWAELNPHEAYRVLKPQGYLIQMGGIPDGLCGELTAELVSDYAWLPAECAPAEVYAPGYPDTTLTVDNAIWNGIPVAGPIQITQFTYVADYGDYAEAAAMMGRLYGPKAYHYFWARKQATFAWRLQIILGQVSK